MKHIVRSVSMMLEIMSHNDRKKLIGIVFGSTKRVEDEIIFALEHFGGVTTIRQIAGYIGMDSISASRVIARMDFTLLNEIRIYKGLFPLYIMGTFKDKRLAKIAKLAAIVNSRSYLARFFLHFRAWFENEKTCVLHNSCINTYNYVLFYHTIWWMYSYTHRKTNSIMKTAGFK